MLVMTGTKMILCIVLIFLIDGKQSVAGDPIASANRAKSQNMEIFVIAIGSEAAKYANVLTNVYVPPSLWFCIHQCLEA